MNLRLIILLTFCFVYTHAYAGTGNELLIKCNHAINVIEGGDVDLGESVGIGECLGYIRGIVDGIQVTDKVNNTTTMCAPDNTTVGQDVRIVVKYMRDNPAELHEPDALLVIKSLILAYPCTE